MKTRITAMLAVATLLACSCAKVQQAGHLSFNLTEGRVDEVETKAKVSDFATLPGSDKFTLVLKDALGTPVYDAAFNDWNPATELKVGRYTAEVSCGSESEEGPSKPYFTGGKEFTVNSGETASVEIPVSLGNLLVRVVCTDDFKKYYPEYSFTLTTPDNKSGFDCTDTAVFVAWKFTVSGTVTSQSGKTFSLEGRTWTGNPATCYTVKYDVTNVGGIGITVSFNDSVENVEVVEIDLNS